MDDLMQSQIRDSCRLAIPEGLNDLMYDISREVLRAQPSNIYKFISKYLSALLVTREHLDLAAHVCGELCNNVCHEDLKDDLKEIGLKGGDLNKAHKIIINYLESGKGKEVNVMAALIEKLNLNENLIPNLQNAIRHAYLKQKIEHPCDIDQTYQESFSQKDDDIARAVNHTMRIYKASKPTQEQYNRMATKIQAAYRGHKVRRSVRVRIHTESSTDIRQFKEIFKPERRYSSPKSTSNDQVKSLSTETSEEDSFRKTGLEESERAVFDYTAVSNFYEPPKSMETTESKMRDSLMLLRKRKLTDTDVTKAISFVRFPSIIPEVVEIDYTAKEKTDSIEDHNDTFEEIDEEIQTGENNYDSSDDEIDELDENVPPSDMLNTINEISEESENPIKEVVSQTELSIHSNMLTDKVDDIQYEGAATDNLVGNAYVQKTESQNKDDGNNKYQNDEENAENDPNFIKETNESVLYKRISQKKSLEVASREIFELDYQTHNSEASLSEQNLDAINIINDVSYDDIEMNASDQE